MIIACISSERSPVATCAPEARRGGENSRASRSRRDKCGGPIRGIASCLCSPRLFIIRSRCVDADARRHARGRPESTCCRWRRSTPPMRHCATSRRTSTSYSPRATAWSIYEKTSDDMPRQEPSRHRHRPRRRRLVDVAASSRQAVISARRRGISFGRGSRESRRHQLTGEAYQARHWR